MQDETLLRLMAIFRDEAHEDIDELGRLLEGLRTATGEALVEAVDTAMRTAHNLKGASAAVGLDSMSRIAHGLEDHLLVVRNEGPSAVPAVIAVGQQAVLALQRLADGETVPVDDLLAALPRRNDTPPPEPAEAGWSSEELTTVQERQPEGLQAPFPDGSANKEPATANLEGAENPSGVRRGVRVDVSRLDELARHAGELIANQAALGSQCAAAETLYEDAATQIAALDATEQAPWGHLLDGLERLAQQERDNFRQTARLADALGDAIRRMRLVPLAALDSTWRRCVAETARVTGKEVALAISSGDVELDKQVLDRLVDPMLHLLRNAVDHGIESPEVRDRKGKPRLGRVRVSGRMSGSMVELSVEDDGGGVDLERLRATALARGRSQDEVEHMAEQDLLDLVFEPGFSTAIQVNTVSGRGLGLDVVRRAVEEFGGHVEWTSRGHLGGAGFSVTVPVNILSTHALLVRAGRVTYALPIDSVARTLRSTPAELVQVDGDRVLGIDGRPVRLRSLARLLQQRAQPIRSRSNGGQHAVVLQRAERWVAVEVDEVLEDQQLSVQRLPWNLRSIRGVTGAVPLPGGGVAVALDIGHLLRASGASTLAERRSSLHPLAAKRILVVDDSLTARTLARHALEAAGYAVVVAEDGLQGWEALRAGDFALLVSDVRMPRLDGIALTQRVRADERLKTLPVILITTVSNPEDVQRGLRAGADEYVVKGPLQQQKLLEAVTRHL